VGADNAAAVQPQNASELDDDDRPLAKRHASHAASGDAASASAAALARATVAFASLADDEPRFGQRTKMGKAEQSQRSEAAKQILKVLTLPRPTRVFS
jgi:hypothetical protein